MSKSEKIEKKEEIDRFKVKLIYDADGELGFAANCWGIQDTVEKKWMLVDVGNKKCYPKVLKAIEEKKIPFADIVLVVLTHHHFDHCGGLSNLLKVLKNAKVVIDKLEVENLKTGKTYLALGSNFMARGMSWIGNTKLGNLFTSFDCIKPDYITEGKKTLVSKFGFGKLSNGEDNSDLYLLRTPGHTDGSLSVIYKDKFAFVGDLAGNTKMFKISPKMWFKIDLPILKSWKTMLDLGIENFYPGHGYVIKRELFQSVYDSQMKKHQQKEKINTKEVTKE